LSYVNMSASLGEREMCGNTRPSGNLVIQKYMHKICLEICKFEELQFRFSPLRFATKLCDSTNFDTLFLAVIMDFVLLGPRLYKNVVKVNYGEN
jgi:hypothetical protein